MQTLLDALKMLETSELIRAAKLEPELEYLFRHGLMQDAAYDSLLKQDRRKLHRAVAASLEALYPKRLDDLAAVLAHHYDAAGETDSALPYYKKAFDTAISRYANLEAISYASRAIDLTPESDLAAHFDLIHRRTTIYQILGDRANQREDVNRLLTLADQLGDPRRRAEAALQQVTLATSTADFATALQAVQVAVDSAQQIKAVEIEARAQVFWGMILWKQSELEAARPHLMQALEQARTANLPDIEADSLRNLGILADYHGNTAEAWAHTEQALPIYQRISNRQGESAALNTLGVIALSDKRHDEARRYLEQSLAIKRELGHVQGISVSLGNLGIVANAQADHAAAHRYHTESLILCRATGDLDGEAASLAGIAFVQNAIGGYEQAWTLAQESLTMSRQIDDDIGSTNTLLILSDIAHHRGQVAEALSLAQEGLELARKVEMREYERYAHVNIGTVSITAGETAAAEAHLSEIADNPQPDKWSIIALAELARMRQTAGDLPAAKSLIERVLAFIDQHGAQLQNDLQVHLIAWQVLDATADPRARAVLTRVYDLLQSQAARMDDEAMRRSFLENVPVNREIVAAYQRLV